MRYIVHFPGQAEPFIFKTWAAMAGFCRPLSDAKVPFRVEVQLADQPKK